MRKVFIAGGAGFIGRHFAQRLLVDTKIELVTVFDNKAVERFTKYNLLADARVRLVDADIKDMQELTSAMQGHDTVIHLASNPDIARAATDPTIDFVEGTLLTQNIVEAMRLCGVRTILYASGSGVYGDWGELELAEDFGPKVPVSTYGSSKLAGETLISAYAYMFDMRGLAFRFGNVVGSDQTHGVAYDFILRLLENPSYLKILGDGSQSKSYVHVNDVINAVLTAHEKTDTFFDVFNVATGSYITVKEIAEIVVQTMFGDGAAVKLEYGTEKRGWKGDIPVVRLNTEKIRALGWQNKMSSEEAIRSSIDSMLVQGLANLKVPK